MRFSALCGPMRHKKNLGFHTNSAYVKSGGKDNPKESKCFTNYAIQAGIVFGAVESDGNTVKPIRPSRKR